MDEQLYSLVSCECKYLSVLKIKWWSRKSWLVIDVQSNRRWISSLYINNHNRWLMCLLLLDETNMLLTYIAIFLTVQGRFLSTMRLRQNACHLQITFSNASSWITVIGFWFKFHCKFVCKSRMDNKSALVQSMAWRHKGTTPLTEPIMTQITEA